VQMPDLSELPKILRCLAGMMGPFYKPPTKSYSDVVKVTGTWRLCCLFCETGEWGYLWFYTNLSL
jgi:hypothetical protein